MYLLAKASHILATSWLASSFLVDCIPFLLLPFVWLFCGKFMACLVAPNIFHATLFCCKYLGILVLKAACKSTKLYYECGTVEKDNNKAWSNTGNFFVIFTTADKHFERGISESVSQLKYFIKANSLQLLPTFVSFCFDGTFQVPQSRNFGTLIQR